MNLLLTAFVIGISSSLFWPTLPPFHWTIIISLCALGLWWCCRPVAALLLGFVYWVFFSQLVFLNSELPDVGHSTITGVIKSLPQQGNHNVSFLFDLDSVSPGKDLIPQAWSGSGKIRLSWYGQHSLQFGERWQFRVKLKPVHGKANQGGFNYQRWLIGQHIALSGNIREGRLLSATDSWRQQVVASLANLSHEMPMGGLLRALAVADKRGIAPAQWQILKKTGTSHLFAISGLHLGVVATGSGALLLMGLNGLRPGSVWQNRRIAVGGALVVALGYAYLAGFSLPTQRALVMLVVASGVWLLQQKMALWELLLWTLAAVLVVDPLALLGASLWLSFTAVSVIFILLWRWPMKGQSKFRKLVTLQLLMFPGLLLIQALWFGGVSLVAAPVNLLLIPWVSVVVIPVVLLAVLCIPLPLVAGFLLTLADWLLTPAWWVMAQMAGSDYAWLEMSRQWQWALLLLTLLLGVSAALPVLKRRWGLLLLLPLLLPLGLVGGSSQPHWSLHFLDVGQGSALVIQRDDRSIIVDTGYGEGPYHSTAARIIEPFLAERGINQVDYLLLSHLDSDHAAGAGQLLATFPTASVITSELMAGVEQQRLLLCHQLLPIQWQGITLTFLSPTPLFKDRNNNSCVVRISDGSTSVLLPGDIEKAAERRLITRYGMQQGQPLDSDIVLVPHHGSLSSSTAEFIEAVSPAHAVISAGFYNRWGFPREDVVARYRAGGADVYNLADTGQVTVEVLPGGVIKIIKYRQNIAPFWYNRQL